MFTNGLTAVKKLQSLLSSRHKSAAFLALACTVALSSISAASADDLKWTVTMVTHGNKAIAAYNRGDFPTAKSEFRLVIGLAPDHTEFYDGLMNAAMHTKEWGEVEFAAKNIARLEPTRAAEVAYPYGVALYQLNRYDEAIPQLKKALTVADKPILPYAPVKLSDDLAALSHIGESHVATPIDKEPPPVPVHVDVKVNMADLSKMENLVRAEFIATATYTGYQKGSYQFNNPPIANFEITKILKGPPLNRHIPIRFEFHGPLDKTMPDGWKFDDKVVMPEKGSEWILFVEYANVKNGAYDTSQGNKGRLPVNEANLNELYGLLDKYNMRNPNSR
jgi:tetratricopeptide (TPR) repeat protein